MRANRTQRLQAFTVNASRKNRKSRGDVGQNPRSGGGYLGGAVKLYFAIITKTKNPVVQLIPIESNPQRIAHPLEECGQRVGGERHH